MAGRREDAAVQRELRVEAVTRWPPHTDLTLSALALDRHFVAEDHSLPLLGCPVLVTVGEGKALTALLVSVVRFRCSEVRRQSGSTEATANGGLAHW
jgi:hypothetical protein